MVHVNYILISAPKTLSSFVVLGVILFVLSACGSHSLAPVRDAGKTSVQTSASNSLMQHYARWRGTPYRNGGSSRRGVDCSAYVQSVYRDVYATKLPRTTKQQAKKGKRVRRSQLREGDLVFFKTGWFGRHVGIYTRSGKFLHASESKGVTVSSLNDSYWSKHYWKSRRILPN